MWWAIASISFGLVDMKHSAMSRGKEVTLDTDGSFWRQDALAEHGDVLREEGAARGVAVQPDGTHEALGIGFTKLPEAKVSFAELEDAVNQPASAASLAELENMLNMTSYDSFKERISLSSWYLISVNLVVHNNKIAAGSANQEVLYSFSNDDAWTDLKKRLHAVFPASNGYPEHWYSDSGRKLPWSQVAGDGDTGMHGNKKDYTKKDYDISDNSMLTYWKGDDKTPMPDATVFHYYSGRTAKFEAEATKPKIDLSSLFNHKEAFPHPFSDITLIYAPWLHKNYRSGHPVFAGGETSWPDRHILAMKFEVSGHARYVLAVEGARSTEAELLRKNGIANVGRFGLEGLNWPTAGTSDKLLAALLDAGIQRRKSFETASLKPFFTSGQNPKEQMLEWNAVYNGPPAVA